MKRYGLRAALNAKCRDCIHDPLAGGTWREQVAQCSAVDCSIWPLRPAPRSGPFADPPRDPATTGREWLIAPHGMTISGLPTALHALGEPDRGCAP